MADGSAAWLPSFVVGHIEPGARVITGAWRGHNGRQDLGYVRERRNQRAGQRLPSSPRMGTRGLRVIRSLPSSWLPRRSRIGQARRCDRMGLQDIQGADADMGTSPARCPGW